MSTTYDGDATNYPTSLTLPSGGDARNAASVNTPLEGLADRTAWLHAHAIRKVQRSTYENPGGTWHRFDGTSYAIFSGGAVDVTNAKVGDILLIDFHATVRVNNDADGSLRVGVIDGYGSGSPDEVYNTGGVARFYGFTPAGGTVYQHVHITNSYEVGIDGTTRVAVYGKATGTEAWIDLVEAGVLRVIHLGSL